MKQNTLHVIWLHIIIPIYFLHSTFTTRSDEDETVRTIIVRDGTIYEEKVEIRRVFVHPGFKFPSLYDDIAVAELGTWMQIHLRIRIQ